MYRSDIRSSKVRDCILDAILLAVALIMPLSKREEAKMFCKTPIVIWLVVAGGIYFASLVRNLIVLCSIYQ